MRSKCTVTLKIRFGSVVAAVMMALLGTAPTALADENSYLQQMRQPNKVFIRVTNNQLLKLGYAACSAMRSAINAGMSMAQARSQGDGAVAQLAYAMGLESDRATNMNITQEAEGNLC